MKSIIYVIVILFVYGLFSSCTSTFKADHNTVILKCVGEDCPANSLKESSEILKCRLLQFDIQEVEISTSEYDKSIEISYLGEMDQSIITSLLTSKGELGVYKTYHRLDIIDQLGVDDQLSEILEIPFDAEEIDGCKGIYGFCKEESITVFDEYIKTRYSSRPNEGIQFCWSKHPDERGYYYSYLLHHHPIFDKMFLKEVQIINQEGSPELQISFSESAKTKWYQFTRKNIGESVAIVIDNEIVGAPIVKSEIEDGRCLLSGDYEIEHIKLIHSLMQCESLPLNFRLIE